MERSRARELARAGLLLLGATLVVALLATVRLVPPADLPRAGLDWMPTSLLGILTFTATATALVCLVAGLRGGTLAALMGAGAAGAVAGGAVVQLAGGSGFIGALPVGGLLFAAAAAADRTRTLVAGRAARLGIAAAGLAAAEAGALAGTVPLTRQVLEPATFALLGAATAMALAGALLSRRLAVSGVLAAIGVAAVLLARGPALELLIGVTAITAAHLEALRSTTARPDHEPAGDDGVRLPELAAHLADAVLQFDGRLQLRDWNPTAGSLLGLDEASRGGRLEDLLGLSITELPARDGSATTASGVGGIQIGLHRSGDGVTAVIRDGRGDADADRLDRELRGTLEELLRARRTIELQREELERSATVDLLTGVLSRGAILDRLRTEIAQARRYQHPVAAVLMDVDRFVDINRRHGVAGGDALLREVALRLRLRIREADALGRAGSDGFLAVLPHTDEEGAATFASALRHRISQRPVLLDEELLTVTTSIGVAVMRPGEDLDLDGVLTRATEALDSARRAGGDRIALDRLHGLARLEDRRRPDVTEEGRKAQDSGR